jgi:signal recognition particle subunit SRP68
MADAAEAAAILAAASAAADDILADNDTAASATTAAAPAAAVAVDISSLPKFSISVLAYTKAAQLQNGLRHNNYLRYRRYCSNRLRTLRRRVGFSHRAPKQVPPPGAMGAFTRGTAKGKPHRGGAHTFVRRALRSDFTDPRYPFLALVSAERAWAYAMQLKQESEGGSNDNTRLKFHFLQRLRKAVFWSGQLKRLAAARGDERTALECEAYHTWLAGNVALESDNWQKALERLVHTRTIYNQLVRTCVRACVCRW